MRLSIAIGCTVVLSGCSGDAGSGVEEHEGTIEYFFADGCPDCHEVEAKYLPVLVAASTGSVVILHNVDDSVSAIERLNELEAELGFFAETMAPVIIVDKLPLVGSQRIRTYVENLR